MRSLSVTCRLIIAVALIAFSVATARAAWHGGPWSPHATHGDMTATHSHADHSGPCEHAVPGKGEVDSREDHEDRSHGCDSSCAHHLATLPTVSPLPAVTPKAILRADLPIIAAQFPFFLPLRPPAA